MITSVHFTSPIPIPGGDEREVHFYAADGWSIERQEDGQILLASGALRFKADGCAYTYTESTPTLSPPEPIARAMRKVA